MISLQIEDPVYHWRIVNDARDNGSLASLLDCLATFTLNAGNVRLRPHGNGGEYAIAWLDSKGEQYMHGGLIYHASTNDWSVHT